MNFTLEEALNIARDKNIPIEEIFVDGIDEYIYRHYDKYMSESCFISYICMGSYRNIDLTHVTTRYES